MNLQTRSIIPAVRCACPCGSQEWHIIGAKAMVPVRHLFVTLCCPNDLALVITGACTYRSLSSHRLHSM